MSAPNLFLIYVRDAEKATAFYRDLFEIEPVFTSPRYVAFEAAPGVLFALWTGRSKHAELMVPGASNAVDRIFTNWVSKGVQVVEEPYDEVFGRTFVIADPDGNLIRVSPVD